MAHVTDVQVGDRFRFRGLNGQVGITGVELEVIGIEPNGQVCIEVDSQWNPPRQHVNLSDIRPLIEQGIWGEIPRRIRTT